MKICFLWYFDKAPQVYDNWRDGLRAAMELIGKDHEVDWVIGKKLPENKYDAILFWDDSNSDFFSHLEDYSGKKGLFLTTDPHNFDNLRKLDVVYCESTPVYEAVRAQGIHAARAFGTDTDFFKPSTQYKQDLNYFYPATFSPWKRQSAIAHLGKELLCVGTVQPDGIGEFEACVANGVRVEDKYWPVTRILHYYQRCRRVPIPAIHGSERTVLEAMSCGIKPEVNPDNHKAYSYVEELEQSGLTPRKFVIENYSHTKYAQDILRGLV